MIPFLQPKTIEHHLEPKNCNQYYCPPQLLQFPIHLAEYLFAKYTSDVHVSCNQLFCHNDHHPAASNAVRATNQQQQKQESKTKKIRKLFKWKLSSAVFLPHSLPLFPFLRILLILLLHDSLFSVCTNKTPSNKVDKLLKVRFIDNAL